MSAYFLCWKMWNASAMQTPPAEKAAGKEVNRRIGERVARRKMGREVALLLRALEPSQRKIDAAKKSKAYGFTSQECLMG